MSGPGSLSSRPPASGVSSESANLPIRSSVTAGETGRGEVKKRSGTRSQVLKPRPGGRTLSTWDTDAGWIFEGNGCLLLVLQMTSVSLNLPAATCRMSSVLHGHFPPPRCRLLSPECRHRWARWKWMQHEKATAGWQRKCGHFGGRWSRRSGGTSRQRVRRGNN